MTDWKFLYVNNKLAIFQPYLKTEKNEECQLGELRKKTEQHNY